MTTIKTEGVRISGSTVRKVSGINAKFIIDSGIGPGAIVEVMKRGEIIPKIERVLKKAKKPSTPSDAGFNWHWSATEVDALLEQSNDVSVVKAKRITNFFTTLKVDNIKLGVVEKLQAAGYDSILKIIKAKPANFLSIDGFKQRSATKLYESIQDKISKPVKLSILMKASGHFPMNIGERRLDSVLTALPGILELYETKSEKYLIEKIKIIPGFQETTARLIVSGLPGFAKWLAKSKLTYTLKAQVTQVSKKLSGISVAFTGFRDIDLEKKILEHGGSVTNGVTKQTTHVLIPDSSFTSSKVIKAEKLGLSILPLDKFLNQFKM
jgi:DNA ligase (NAD+)